MSRRRGATREAGTRWAPGTAALLAALLAAPALAGEASSRELDALFELSVSELLEVPVVTASRHAEPRWRTPSAVTVVSGETLRRYGHRTLADALRTVVGYLPGFDGWRELSGVRGEFGQGTFNSRLLWLVDGHRVNEGFFQSAYPGESFPVDLSLVDRVEVMRGPGSALYGSNAFFGVVNVVTRAPAQAQGATLTLSAGGALSSTAPEVPASDLDPLSQRQFAATLGTSAGGAEILVGLSARRDEGQPIWYPYFTGTGAPGLADRKNWVESDRLFLDVRRGAWRVFGGYAHTGQGNPEANYGAIPDSPLNATATDAWFLEVRHQAALAEGLALSSRLHADGNSFWRDWHMEGYWPLDRKEVRTSWVGLEEQLDWRAGPSRLQAGLEVQLLDVIHHEDYPSEETAPGVPFVNDYHGAFLNYAAYANEELELGERWFLTGGLRVEGNDVDGAVLTGRGALVFRPWASTVLKAQAGQGFKNTPINFYSYHSSELGLFQWEISPLERESVTSLELVWSQLLAPFSLEVVLYRNEVRDLITYEPATDSYDNGPGLDTLGVEAEAALALTGRLSLYGNWSWLRSENRDGSPVLNVPRWSVKGGAAAKVLDGGLLTAAAEGQLYGAADYQDFPAQRPGVDLRQGQHGVVNATLTGQAIPLRLAWSLGVQNLLNAGSGYPVANGTREPFPAAGRSWRASLELRY